MGFEKNTLDELLKKGFVVDNSLWITYMNRLYLEPVHPKEDGFKEVVTELRDYLERGAQHYEKIFNLNNPEDVENHFYFACNGIDWEVFRDRAIKQFRPYGTVKRIDDDKAPWNEWKEIDKIDLTSLPVGSRVFTYMDNHPHAAWMIEIIPDGILVWRDFDKEPLKGNLNSLVSRRKLYLMKPKPSSDIKRAENGDLIYEGINDEEVFFFEILPPGTLATNYIVDFPYFKYNYDSKRVLTPKDSWGGRIEHISFQLGENKI